MGGAALVRIRMGGGSWTKLRHAWGLLLLLLLKLLKVDEAPTPVRNYLPVDGEMQRCLVMPGRKVAHWPWRASGKQRAPSVLVGQGHCTVDTSWSGDDAGTGETWTVRLLQCSVVVQSKGPPTSRLPFSARLQNPNITVSSVLVVVSDISKSPVGWLPGVGAGPRTTAAQHSTAQRNATVRRQPSP